MGGNFTNINELGLALIILAGSLTLALPRRFAPIPLLAVGMYMTMGQTLDVFGLHFDVLRVMLLFGWTRLILRSEAADIKLNEIDMALLGWVFVNAALYSLREMSAAALINRLGFVYDAVGFYFFFRALVRCKEDCLILIKALALLAIPLACLMVLEKATGKNPFHYFGGVPEFVPEREGRLRCQGPFRHPILAGTFGAVAVPLCVGLWTEGKDRVAAVAAAVASTVMVVTSASSGPVLAYIAAIVVLPLWVLRGYLRELRWAAVGAVVALHFVMKAPVWYIFDRISDFLGGTGWHRSELIDQAITRIDEWWLLGTSQTSHWMPYKLRLFDAADITNQYIAHGLDGGLATMVLFIAVIALCFRRVGLAVRAADMTEEESQAEGSSAEEAPEEEPAGAIPHYLPWALGSALFVHVVSFVSVVYFDQMVVYWYMLLAMIACLPTGREDDRWSPGVVDRERIDGME